MFDITIDGVSYNYVDKCELDGKNYIVFDNEEGVYVSEYKYENEEFIFITPDLEIQKKVLEMLGIEYE